MSQESYPYASPPVEPQNSGLAIGSLIAGIAGLFILPIAGGIVGLILGYMAKKQIRESGGTLKGGGMATAGVILGWIEVALPVLAICVIVILALMGPAIGDIFSSIVTGM